MAVKWLLETDLFRENLQPLTEAIQARAVVSHPG